MKGAVVGGLIAQQHREGGGQLSGFGEGESFALQAQRAVLEPVVLGHIDDQEFFREVSWLVLRDEAVL